MKTLWLNSAKTEEERRSLKEYILGSKKVLDILSEICYNMYKDDEKVALKDYDSASWACKQAHLNGRKEVIRDLLDLLDLSKDFNK